MSRQIIEAADAVVEAIAALEGLVVYSDAAVVNGRPVMRTRYARPSPSSPGALANYLGDDVLPWVAVHHAIGRYRFVVEQAVEQAPARPGRPARPVVYIAAPFAGHTLAEVAENTHRAEALNLYAIRRGYAPICVHSGALRGAYGRDTDAGDRKAALDVDRALLDVSGEVWALTRDDGTLSPGMLVELDHWSSTGRPPWTLNTWAGWSAEFERLNVLS